VATVYGICLTVTHKIEICKIL